MKKIAVKYGIFLNEPKSKLKKRVLEYELGVAEALEEGIIFEAENPRPFGIPRFEPPYYETDERAVHTWFFLTSIRQIIL